MTTPTSCPARLPRTLLAGLLLALLLLTACNRDREATPTPEAAAPQPGAVEGAAPAAGTAGAADAGRGPAAAPPAPTPFVPQGDLVLWHSWAGPDAEALVAILTQLKESTPLVNVETLYVSPNDLPQAFADAVAVGAGPDLAVTENWWIDDLIAAEALRPLDDLAPLDTLAGFVPAALATFQRDGFLYALPATYQVVGLYQNTALAPAGQTPATTDALLAGALTSPTQGVGLYANLFHLWWGFPAYGAQLFDPSGRVVIDQGGGAAEFLAWMKQIAGVPGSYVDSDYGMLVERFTNGEFAYFVDGPWAAAELRAALGESLTVVPLPAGPVAAAQPWLSAEGVVINPNLDSGRARLAYFLAELLTNAESGSRFAAGGRLPAHQGATLPDDPLLRGFAAQAVTAQPAPPYPEMEAVWGYGGDMLGKVLGGSMEPDAAVRETAALINEETGR